MGQYQAGAWENRTQPRGYASIRRNSPVRTHMLLEKKIFAAARFAGLFGKKRPR